MKPTRLPIVLYLLLVFASGVLVGVFSQRLYSARVAKAACETKSESYRQRYIEEMRSRLGLSNEQVVQLNAILDSVRSRYQAARAKCRPEIESIHAEQVEQTRAILTDKQQPEYQKMVDEWEQRQLKKQRQH